MQKGARLMGKRIKSITASERREEILEILMSEREVTSTNLAREFGVSKKTILTDIEILMTRYPIEKVRGNKGGLKMDKNYHPYRMTMTRKETDTLVGLKDRCSEEEWAVISNLLKNHSSYYQVIEK